MSTFLKIIDFSKKLDPMQVKFIEDLMLHVMK
jgi:hypothetical protein